MDITGCSHLFGGENKMIKHILLAYDEIGLTSKIGCADTVGAAWALSRYSEKVVKIIEMAIPLNKKQEQHVLVLQSDLFKA